MEIVAAMSENLVIGADGKMPWHLPADLAHFKNLTTGHVIVMGRRTWESIGTPLPNRTSIVITRQQDFEARGAVVVHSLEEAIAEAGDSKVFIIGGGEIYTLALALADQLHLTRIHTTLDGDTFFPHFDESHWVKYAQEEYPSDGENPHDITFETWKRVE